MSTTHQSKNVQWTNYKDSLGIAFPRMLNDRKFVDVTLACEGRRIHCHRLVLAASSTFFENLLEENPGKHPIIILPKDVKFWTVQALVEFMYRGEISVHEEDFEQLVKCAEILQIQGFKTEYGSKDQEGHEESQVDLIQEFKAEIPEVSLGTQSSGEVFNVIIPKEEPVEPVENYWTSSIPSISQPGTSHEPMSYNPEDFSNLPNPQGDFSEVTATPKTRKKHKVNSPIGRFPKDFLESPPENFVLPKHDRRTFDAKSIWSALMSIKGGMSARNASKIYKIPNHTVRVYMNRYGIKSTHPQGNQGKTTHRFQPYS
ncbi:hypothetical protein DMENIID0001_135950 [Sergentomyia squamirostris]